MRNLQEQVRKAFCYQKLFWSFTDWTNCSSGLKMFANSWPSASNFKSFSRSLEHFFLTVGLNNFGNKIPIQFPKYHATNTTLRILSGSSTLHFTRTFFAPLCNFFLRKKKTVLHTFSNGIIGLHRFASMAYETGWNGAQRAKFSKKVHKPPFTVNVINFN